MSTHEWDDEGMARAIEITNRLIQHNIEEIAGHGVDHPGDATVIVMMTAVGAMSTMGYSKDDMLQVLRQCPMPNDTPETRKGAN